MVGCDSCFGNVDRGSCDGMVLGKLMQGFYRWIMLIVIVLNSVVVVVVVVVVYSTSG